MSTCYQALAVSIQLAYCLADIYHQKILSVVLTYDQKKDKWKLKFSGRKRSRASLINQLWNKCAKKKWKKQRAYSFSVYVKLPSIDGMGPDSSLKLRSLDNYMIKKVQFNSIFSLHVSANASFQNSQNR